MTLISITIPTPNHRAKVELQGVPDGVIPVDSTTGAVVSSIYYLIPNDSQTLATGEVVDDQLISLNGSTGSFYRVTVYSTVSDEITRQADFDITGDTLDLDTATPLAEAPLPGVIDLPSDPIFIDKNYVDTHDASTLSSAESFATAADTAVLSSAESFATNADTTVLSTAETHSDAGDATTLASAESYADTGDANTLAAAKAYTDGHTGGGAVTSVAGKTGAVTLVENDIANLSTDLSTLSTSISSETSRAEGAEGTLSTAISTETSRAESAEATLTTSINNEVTRAETAEQNIASRVNSIVQSGLLAEYRMTETSGTSLVDYSGNNNNGIFGARQTITTIAATSTTLTITTLKAHNYLAGNAFTIQGLTNTAYNISGTITTILNGTQFSITGSFTPISSTSDSGNIYSGYPTRIANTGGLSFAAASHQAVSLPAALNTAKSILLVTFFDPLNVNNGEFPSPIGPDATSAGVGPNIMYSYAQQGVKLPPPSGSYYQIVPWAGGFKGAFRECVHGYIVLTWVTNGTTDNIYFYDNPSINSATPTIGNPTGNYQLGAGAGAGASTWYQGSIVYAALWNITLTSAQVAQNSEAVMAMLRSRGIPLDGKPGNGTWQNPGNNDTFVLDGDSETEFLLAANMPTLTNSPFTINTSAPGSLIESIAISGASAVDVQLPSLTSATSGGNGAGRAAVIIWAGTNDEGGQASTTHNSLAKYCRDRRKVGWGKIAVVTMVSRSGVDSFKNSYNALIRNHWSEYSDMLIDMAAIPVFGADGAFNNSAYLISGLHIQTTVSQYLGAWIYSFAMRRMYGNSLFGVPNTAIGTYLMTAEDIFVLADSTSGNVSIYLPPAQFLTGQTLTIRNVSSGGNSVTLLPKPISANITNFSLTGNIATITCSNNFQVGDVVVLFGLTTNPTLNGSPIIISTVGSTITGALTHANISSASETGQVVLASHCQLGAITNIVENSSSVVTLSVPNNYTSGDTIKFSGLTVGTWLNGQSATLTSATSSSIQFTDPTSHGTQASAAETGFTLKTYAQDLINGGSSLVVSNGATCILLGKLASPNTGLANWLSLQNG